MTVAELIAELRSRISPAYAMWPGTESYERRECVEALEAQAAEIERLKDFIGMAYGYLWCVNNEPGTPNQYPPGKAAYEARKLLRDTMTHEQRGDYIHRVVTIVRGIGA